MQVLDNINKIADELIQITELSFPDDAMEQFRVLIAALVRWTAKYTGVVELLTTGLGAINAAREAAEKVLAAKKPS